jgi:hypothetical protein
MIIIKTNKTTDIPLTIDCHREDWKQYPDSHAAVTKANTALLSSKPGINCLCQYKSLFDIVGAGSPKAPPIPINARGHINRLAIRET